MSPILLERKTFYYKVANHCVIKKWHLWMMRDDLHHFGLFYSLRYDWGQQILFFLYVAWSTMALLKQPLKCVLVWAETVGDVVWTKKTVGPCAQCAFKAWMRPAVLVCFLVFVSFQLLLKLYLFLCSLSEEGILAAGGEGLQWLLVATMFLRFFAGDAD